MKKIIQLEGLDCAECMIELEAILENIEGVMSASIALIDQKLILEYETKEALRAVIAAVNDFEEVRVVDEQQVNGTGIKTAIRIKNLDCPACAGELQEELQKLKGVVTVSVDYVSQKIFLEAEDQNAVLAVIDAANHFEEVEVLDEGRYETNTEKVRNSHLKDWLLIGISAVLFLGAFLLEKLASGTVANVLKYVCYAIAYFTVGYPVLILTGKNIAKGKVFDENFLMTVASLGAVCIGETSEAVLVMLLYQLGELLQSIAVGSSRRSVTELMDLKSERATLLVDGVQKEVRPEALRVGDVVLVKTGEKSPVDGILLDEEAVLDTKSLTGESEYRTVKKDGEILSGCINVGGMYAMKAIRPYEDSAVGKILDMVENASSGKAAPEKFITKFARYYTPIVCSLALAIVLFVPLISGLIIDGRFYFKDFGRWVQSALTFLVISCPCALIISVPLTYFSGIGTCAKNGILVKGATYLDVAAKAKIVAFDKTGTLTLGNFTVRSLHPQDSVEEKELLAIAAAVERGSAHPIAKAFVELETPYMAERLQEKAGRGLIAEIDGQVVLVGNEKLLREHDISFISNNSPYTLIYVAKNGRFLGVIEIGDKLRPETKTAIADLKTLRVDRMIMLTGDGEARAQKIANEVGMYEVNAELLPDQKLKKAEELKKEGVLIYVGDGINDAPVMATADCAVSMGKLGSAAAVEASDMVLISDNLNALPKGIRIARKTRAIVVQNIVFSIVMKVAFMALGVAGVLPLWLAVFADVGVMLLAVLNSFRVRARL